MRRLLCALAAVIGLSAPALAQTPTPTAAPTGGTLSDKLDKSHGVIKPGDVDPGMDKTAPTTHDPNVIAPPSPQAK